MHGSATAFSCQLRLSRYFPPLYRRSSAPGTACRLRQSFTLEAGIGSPSFVSSSARKTLGVTGSECSLSNVESSLHTQPGRRIRGLAIASASAAAAWRRRPTGPRSPTAAPKWTRLFCSKRRPPRATIRSTTAAPAGAAVCVFAVRRQVRARSRTGLRWRLCANPLTGRRVVHRAGVDRFAVVRSSLVTPTLRALNVRPEASSAAVSSCVAGAPGPRLPHRLPSPPPSLTGCTNQCGLRGRPRDLVGCATDQFPARLLLGCQWTGAGLFLGLEF